MALLAPKDSNKGRRNTYSSGQQQSSAITGSVVGEANLDTISGKFVSICACNHDVTLNTSISYLSNDIGVGDSHNHSVNLN